MKKINKKNIRYILSVIVFAIILFSANETFSGYKSQISLSSQNAIPIVEVETSDYQKTIEFIDYGWSVYNFDVINGKMGNDGMFYVNEVDMEYYIKAIKDSGDLELKIKALYIRNDKGDIISEPYYYDEEKGFGPFDLKYKVDDELVFNQATGYYESKYVSRVHYMIVYYYGSCEQGETNCVIDANQAGKDYNFHIEVKSYQKVK